MPILNEKETLESSVKELSERRAALWAQMQQIDFLLPLVRARLDAIDADHKIDWRTAYFEQGTS